MLIPLHCQHAGTHMHKSTRNVLLILRTTTLTCCMLSMISRHDFVSSHMLMHTTILEVSDLYAEQPWAILDRMRVPREVAEAWMLHCVTAVTSACSASIM